MYTFLIILFHEYLGLLWSAHGVACCLSFWSLSKSACFQGGVFPKGKVIECVFYESTKQQTHQTTEGFPRFSIQTFPSFFLILFGGFLVRGTALRRVSARARGFNCVLASSVAGEDQYLLNSGLFYYEEKVRRDTDVFCSCPRPGCRGQVACPRNLESKVTCGFCHLQFTWM